MTPSDSKEAHLRRWRTLNRHPEKVRDPLFEKEGLFDPRDMLQVRYEMVRRVDQDGQSVREVARTFGVSRPTFYEVRDRLRERGLPGLIPEQRGPRHGHKVTDEVLRSVSKWLEGDPKLTPTQLAQRIAEEFGRKVHPRTVARALARGKKPRARLRSSRRRRL